MKSSRLFVCTVLLFGTWGQLAHAELGGSPATINTVPGQPNASRRILTAEKFKVHEYQLASGTMVREYLSPVGRVFAVAWSGPLMPNLEDLLGIYFGQYTQAVELERAGPGPVTVQRQGLVVHSAGHMRAFSGKAYLPELLPINVTAQEIR